MKAFTPEISWHNRLPTLSMDISSPVDGSGHVYRIATGGNDCRVYIWLIDIGKTSASNRNPSISIRAGLRRHQKSIGSVRFSPNQILASGDDDGYIYLWRHNTEQEQEHLTEALESNAFLNDDGFEDLELWQQQRVLRGHIEDICDLSWSKDGQFLLSGSVDNSAILWDATKGTKIWCSDPTKGYVQGVAVDPKTQFFATISSDRTLRIYNFNDKRLQYATRRMIIKGKFKAFFCDDTLQTFCRRLEFSPDGQFLIVPSSRMIEREKHQQQTCIVPEDSPKVDKNEEKCKDSFDESLEVSKSKKIKLADDSDSSNSKQPSKPINSILVFKVPKFNKPTHYYPTGREVALCVRFSPVLYTLRDIETNFWGIPYRIVFAVATSRSVIIYDSQQATPIGYASQIHLARLTDLAWSHDGRMLTVSSYDGYITMLTFEEGEFGEHYTGPMLESVPKPVAAPKVAPKPIVSQRQAKINVITSVSRQPTLHSLWKK